MSDATPDDLWTPHKHLLKVVSSYLTSPTLDSSISNLDIILRNHKQNFINLLKNPPKNLKSREEIRNGITAGLTLPGLGHTVLSKDLVDETIIISDMYDLNEYVALELICTAQQQMPHHPGLPRGLVAVLLYYDGRKTLLTTLKNLFESRIGISWCTDIPQEVTKVVTSYTDSLVSDGVLIKILHCLETLDVSKEMEILTKNRALGPPKHHRQVLDLFEEIRLLLATILYNWSAQCGLPKNVAVKLINFLSKYKPASETRGGIDDVTLSLQMALLYALDLSVLQRREDGEDVVRRLPLIIENGFPEAIADALTINFECDGLKAFSKFAFGIALTTLRLAPQNLQLNAIKVIDQDEQFVDDAIHNKIFDFIHYTLLDNDNIFTTEFFYRKIHVLLTDFIELMHSKITELRARADETAKTVQCYMEQGIDPPPNLCHNFESLLLAVGKLYENDKLGLGLSLEYWGPMEIAGNYQKSSSRSVSLFKFIRLAGELLPPILFIPYLKMLAGLSSSQQSARNAFNLLKQGSGVSGSNTLSWDHFFNSLTRYYVNLRQEQNPSSETVYRNRALNRNISPQELAGLQAVLCVVRAVANYDEVARIALCEHPSWSPLNVLVGLVTCSCPITLKTDLLLTLEALAKSKDTSLQLWHIIEASQIITTIPSTNTISTRGIESELEQIESRNETYPLTRAMLELLYTLVKTAVPKNLGAGPRKPGLDPYLTFIIDTVFLRFYSRTYKDAAEKWLMAEICLKLLDMFIKNYDPNPSDYPSTKQTLKEENSPPGFHIMLQMNTKSELFRLILHIIDETCTLIDTYTPFNGKKNLETCSLYCLNIIEKSLSQQELFSECHFTTNCSILLTGTNKLLLGINPRSGQPDHMLNITKFVCYNNWLTKHSFTAVRILNYVIRLPNVNNYLIGLFTQNEKIKNEIRHGFVECLENEININCNDENNPDNEIELFIKEAILNLLQESLPQPAPNFAHYLLGFDINKDIRSTRFQQPGVMNFPSTCTKSLIILLDNSLEAMKDGQQKNSNPAHEKLIGNAYMLLYSLCSNSRTSEPILRFLRTCNDFLSRHMLSLPFENSNNPRILNHMTGLLKSVAIELKMSAANSQVTQFGNLCKILLGVSQNHLTENINGTNTFSLLNTNSNQISATTSMGNKRLNEHGGSNRLMLCQLLDCLDFDIKSLEMPKWDYFDNSLMQGLFKNCEITSNFGPKLIDIKKLHDILKDELNTVQTTMAAGQRQLILQEIETILLFALQLNTQKNACTASIKFLEAWGQVTEILFSVAPLSALTIEVKQGLIIEILQVLLNKIVSAQATPELANLASSTVLLLLVNLRHCYTFKYTQNDNSPQNIGNYTNQTMQQRPSQIQISSSNTLSLKYILKNIVEWIIISGVASQKLRINLYASLLNYMHIIKRNHQTNNNNEDQFYVSRLDKSLMQVGNNSSEVINQSELAIEVFTTFGDKLFDILCHDCTGGHDVCKMLAFSCIDMLLDIDSMTNFLQFISRRGYLSHLIDSLMKSDNQLCHILETTPDNLKALYVYESKMAMLSRFASTHIGAELLLEQKTLGVLSGMRVYDLHPDFQLSNNYPIQQYTTFVPPVEIRYRQILFPALNLCDVILSTLGSENNSAINQIIHFLLSHGEMIEIILRAGTPFMNLGLLEELSAVTGLIARSTNQEILSTFVPDFNLDVGAHLYRMQKLMLTLLPRFIITETTVKEMYQPDNLTYDPNEKNKSRHMKLILQIACNLLLYARNAISNCSADHRTINILFSPNINDYLQKDSNIGSLKSSPSLGLIVAQLKSCVDNFNRDKIQYDNLLRHQNTLPGSSLDTNVQGQLDNVSERLKYKQEEIKLCIFITEHCLYLIWAHLDFYMSRAVPVNSFQLNNSNLDETYMSATEAGWKITKDDVGVLKNKLVTILNETFCRQIVGTTEDLSITDKGFVEALIRRIKRLIQFVPVN